MKAEQASTAVGIDRIKVASELAGKAKRSASPLPDDSLRLAATLP